MTFDNWISQLQSIPALVQTNLPISLSIIAGLWLIYFINLLLGGRLNILGIYSRHPLGLIGIFFSPFLHSNFNHLFFNSIPLFVLINFMLLDGLQTFIRVSIIIILLSGLGTWLFGRKAIHIGASSVIMGYWSYLLLSAYKNPTVLSLVLALVCLYYFGGLLFSLFPSEEKVSWEGHVFGFLAGIAAFYWYH